MRSGVELSLMEDYYSMNGDNQLNNTDLVMLPSDFANIQLHYIHRTTMSPSFDSSFAAAVADNTTTSASVVSNSDQLFLANTRLICSMILAPIITLIGVMLNIINILVLRKIMHASTNFYLMCLATFDLSYLIFSLIMRIDLFMPNEPWFQYYYGWGQFLTDFCSNMSVMLVVAFTTERSVVIMWPLKGKAWCTTENARRLVTMIAVWVFLLTFPTILEFEVVVIVKPAPSSGLSPVSSNGHPHPQDQQVVTTYVAQPTRLGDDFETYYYWATSLAFVFLPLILVIVLNAFLLRSIRRSTLRRSSMVEGQQLDPLRAQHQNAVDHRITLLLVTVVLVFILLQTPTAVMLLIWAWASDDFTKRHGALLRGLGNIFNLFMTVNACANFFLYAGLSQRFRAMFLRMFCARYDCLQSSPPVTISTPGASAADGRGLSSHSRLLLPSSAGSISRSNSFGRQPHYRSCASPTPSMYQIENSAAEVIKLPEYKTPNSIKSTT